jgi:putative membrane protein
MPVRAIRRYGGSFGGRSQGASALRVEPGPFSQSSADAIGIERFKVMERKLFFGIMTPGALLTILFGVWMMLANRELYAGVGWLHAKLALVAVLIAYHSYLGKLLFDFRNDRNRHGHVFYRWVNEFPVLILISVVILAVVKPF